MAPKNDSMSTGEILPTRKQKLNVLIHDVMASLCAAFLSLWQFISYGIDQFQFPNGK